LHDSPEEKRFWEKGGGEESHLILDHEGERGKLDVMKPLSKQKGWFPKPAEKKNSREGEGLPPSLKTKARGRGKIL